MKNMKKIVIMMLCVLSLAFTMTACAGKSKCDNCGKETTVFDADVNGEKMKLCSDCMEKLVSDKVDELDGSESSDNTGQESDQGSDSDGEVKEIAVDEHSDLSVDGYESSEFEWEVIEDAPDDPETYFSLSVQVDDQTGNAYVIGYNPGTATVQATHKENGETYCFTFRVVGNE